MPDVDVGTVLIGTVLAFVLGAGYYAALGDRLAAVRGSSAETATTAWAMPVELLRCLVLAAVVAGLAAAARVDTWTGGLWLGIVLWVGFPFVLWAGAIVHERTPWRLAAIHGGDWLVKLVALGVLAGALL